jgi:hypothetical protein
MRRILVLMMVLAGSSVARGETLPDGGVTAPEVAGELKKAGYPADFIAADHSGGPLVRSSTGKFLFNVRFYQCDAQLRCASITFIAPGHRKLLTAATIAAWNRDRRFGRAFQDGSGAAWIAMDVETGRGMTTEALGANISRWIGVLDAFESFATG